MVIKELKSEEVGSKRTDGNLTPVYFNIYCGLLKDPKTLKNKREAKKIVKSFNRWIAIRKHLFTSQYGDYSKQKENFIDYLKELVANTKKIL